LSLHLFRQPELANYLKWFAVTVPVFSVFIIVLNATQGLKRMEFVVLSRDFFQPISMFLLALAFIYFFSGPTAFLAGYLCSVIVGLATSVYFLNRVCPALDRQTSPIFEWKILLSFSLPITGTDLAHYLFRWFDTFLLSFFRTTIEVGLYNAALRTTLLLSLLAISLNALYGPIIADHHHRNNYQEMQMILKTLVRWCITLSFPILLSMIILSKDILSLWGPEFVAGSTSLVVLAASQFFFVPSALLSFTLLMCGKQYIELGNTVSIFALNVVMNLFLIPRYGINGAAISMLISQFVAFLCRWVEVSRILNVQLYTLKYIKPFIAMVFVFSLSLVLRNYLMNIFSNFFSGTQIAAMAIMFFLIVSAYLLILFILRFEEEDLMIWRDIRNHRALTVLTNRT